MLNFEIKTHQSGRTYDKPHFFILNKGLNSGKPMHKPCPNCFVITAATKEQIQTLFYMCLSLKIGRYFAYFLKGSVIPFICISDTRAVLKTALENYEGNNWKIKIDKLRKITAFEENLKLQLKAISDLKIALLRS